MPVYAYVLVAAGFFLWFAPFVLARRGSHRPEKLDRRARWGIALEGSAYAVLWQGNFWTRSPERWQVALSAVFFAIAIALSWTGVRSLGRQWRIDAGLSADHELVQSGPYRVVRHPIYTSMLCALLGTGLIIARWPLLLLAMVLFFIGTEIRVRIEDALLASRFGDQFRNFQHSVSAYIPFLR